MRYYLYDEVVLHNKKDDFWVVIHRNIFNLTPLIKDRKDHWNRNMEYLMQFGGKDLTHLFQENGEPRTEISAISGRPRVLFPPILEVAISSYSKSPNCLWSQDPFYHIGQVTRRERRLRIINTLTGTTQFMKVCDEDTIFDIQKKYGERYNSHAGSYDWRKFSNGGQISGKLRLNETLDENELFDDEECAFQLPPPSLWLYYTDDLTIG